MVILGGLRRQLNDWSRAIENLAAAIQYKVIVRRDFGIRDRHCVRASGSLKNMRILEPGLTIVLIAFSRRHTLRASRRGKARDIVQSTPVSQSLKRPWIVRS